MLTHELFLAMEDLTRKVDLLLKSDTRRNKLFPLNSVHRVQDNSSIQVGHTYVPPAVDQVKLSGPSYCPTSRVHTVIRPDGRKETSFTQPNPVGDNLDSTDAVCITSGSTPRRSSDGTGMGIHTRCWSGHDSTTPVHASLWFKPSEDLTCSYYGTIFIQ